MKKKIFKLRCANHVHKNFSISRVIFLRSCLAGYKCRNATHGELPVKIRKIDSYNNEWKRQHIQLPTGTRCCVTVLFLTEKMKDKEYMRHCS